MRRIVLVFVVGSVAALARAAAAAPVNCARDTVAEHYRVACAQFAPDDFLQARACGDAAAATGCVDALAARGVHSNSERYALAQARWHSKDSSSALALLQPLIAARVRAAPVHNLHGVLLLERNELELALRSLARAIAYDPTFIYARANFSRALVRQREKEPLARFEEMLRADGEPQELIRRAGARLAMNLCYEPERHVFNYDPRPDAYRALSWRGALPPPARASLIECVAAHELLHAALGQTELLLNEADALPGIEPHVVTRLRVLRGRLSLARGHVASGSALLQEVIDTADMATNTAEVREAINALVQHALDARDGKRALEVTDHCAQRDPDYCLGVRCQVLERIQRKSEAALCEDETGQRRQDDEPLLAAMHFRSAAALCNSSGGALPATTCRAMAERGLAAITRTGDRPEGQLTAAELLEQLGRNAEAQAVMDRLAPQVGSLSAPSQIHYHVKRSTMALNAGRLDDALRARLAAADLNAAWDPRAAAFDLRIAAGIESTQRRYESALRLLSRASDLARMRAAGAADVLATIADARARWLAALGDEDALKAIDEALPQVDALPGGLSSTARQRLHFDRCTTLFSLGRFADAERLCEEAASVQPGTPEAVVALSRSLAVALLLDAPERARAYAVRAGIPERETVETGIVRFEMAHHYAQAALLLERAAAAPDLASTARDKLMLRALTDYLNAGEHSPALRLYETLRGRPEPVTSIARAEWASRGGEPDPYIATTAVRARLDQLLRDKQTALAALEALTLDDPKSALTLAEQSQAVPSASIFLRAMSLVQLARYNEATAALDDLNRVAGDADGRRGFYTIRSILRLQVGDIEGALADLRILRASGVDRFAANQATALEILAGALSAIAPAEVDSSARAFVAAARASRWAPDLPRALAVRAIQSALVGAITETVAATDEATKLLESPGAGLSTAEISRLTALAAALVGDCRRARRATPADAGTPVGAWNGSLEAVVAEVCRAPAPSASAVLEAMRRKYRFVPLFAVAGLYGLSRVHATAGRFELGVDALVTAAKVAEETQAMRAEAPQALARFIANAAFQLLADADAARIPAEQWQALVARALEVDSHMRLLALAQAAPEKATLHCRRACSASAGCARSPSAQRE